ncbi:MAG: hypothetical protein HQL40_20690 [Alphaproteobacteria bacterium]|nr:hypothetical protein [Alphaproteobacteria bacterium]
MVDATVVIACAHRKYLLDAMSSMDEDGEEDEEEDEEEEEEEDEEEEEEEDEKVD